MNKPKQPDPIHPVAIKALTFCDSNGPATLKEIAIGIGASESTVRRYVRLHLGLFETEQRLGAAWGRNYAWKLVYFRQKPRFERSRVPDVWDDPIFQGHGNPPRKL